MSETRERLGLQAIHDRDGQPVAFVAPAEELDLLIDQKDAAVTLLEGLLNSLVDLSISGEVSESGFLTLCALISEGSHPNRLDLDLDRVKDRTVALRGTTPAGRLSGNAAGKYTRQRPVQEGIHEATEKTDDDESEIIAIALKRLSSQQVRFPSAKVKSLLMNLETLSSSKKVDASDVEMLIEGM